MLFSLPSHMSLTLRSPRFLSGLALVVAAGAGYASWRMTRTEPDLVAMERERREFLATNGRIIDGTITEARWRADAAEPVATTLIYSYRIAGVTYECAQDVSLLPEFVRHVRADLPVQVRFDPRNPGDSIVVSETWSGLRIDHDHFTEPASLVTNLS